MVLVVVKFFEWKVSQSQICQKFKIVFLTRSQVHNQRPDKNLCFWINASGLFFTFYGKCYFQEAVCKFIMACLDYLSFEF